MILQSNNFLPEDEDITERSSLLEAGIKAGLGEEMASKMADMTTTEDIKLKLKELTQEAIDLGVRAETL